MTAGDVLSAAATAPGVGSHWLGTAAGAGSALFFAVGAVVEQEATLASTSGGTLDLRGMVRRPAWIAGMAANVVGVGLQILALALAPVSIVQPLLAGGLVVALGIRSVRDRRRPSGRELLGSVLTAGGLAVFLVAARPADVSRDRLPDAPAVLAIALAALALVALTARAKQTVVGALSAGLAAGIAMGIAAVLVSAALTILGRDGLLAALATPSLWGAIVVSIGAQVACQVAFSRGSLSWSLPVLTVADPLAAVPVALWLLGERLEPGHAHVWGPAAVVAAVGVVLLARAADAGKGEPRPAISTA
jgi:drug/metabolite transporter (DMT)-like permease